MAKRRKLERSVNAEYYHDILLCCVPLLGMSCYFYGLRPLLLMLTGLLTAYICDGIVTPLHSPGYHSRESSSEAFAALCVLLMPATVGYGLVVATVVIAVLAKEAFGGEGHYPFHPAAVGVAVAGVSWPNNMFCYPTPGTRLPLWDVSAISTSTGMTAVLRDGGLPTASTMNLLVGNTLGPMGATATLVILACGLYLLVRGHLQPSVFLPYMAILILGAWLFPQLNEIPAGSMPWAYIRQRIYLEKYVLLGGTALFGGVMLACEPVVQPSRFSSRVVYGLALGAVVTIFRFYSTYETGVCFALLLAGAFPEWLDRLGRRVERIRFMRKEEERRARNTRTKRA